MNKHVLKILPQHYNNVASGTKTFEIRKNDRAFQKGDSVILRAWDNEFLGYPNLEFTIGDVYPIDSERVVFSLLTKEVE
jgi:hypothetical protein